MTGSGRYFDGAKFEALLNEYLGAAGPDRDEHVLERLITKFFMPLAEGYVRTLRRPFAEAEDLVQEGVVLCVKKMELFDASRGSAFNFFTKIVARRCLDVNAGEGRQAAVKAKALEEAEGQAENGRPLCRKEVWFAGEGKDGKGADCLEEVVTLMRLTSSVEVLRGALCVWLNGRFGMVALEIEGIVGWHAQTVRAAVRAYRVRGAKGLEKRRRGRKTGSVVDLKRAQELAAIERVARRYEDGMVVDFREFKIALQRERGVEMSRWGVYKVMKKHGFCSQAKLTA